MIARIIALLIVIPLAVTGAWLAWQLFRDPLVALPHAAGVRMVSFEFIDAQAHLPQGRRYQRLSLETNGAGTAKFTISLPKGRAPQPLPVLIILGGLTTGADSMSFLPQPGRNALVAYEYQIEKSNNECRNRGQMLVLDNSEPSFAQLA